MRISDWSSDVCSSDLATDRHRAQPDPWAAGHVNEQISAGFFSVHGRLGIGQAGEIEILAADFIQQIDFGVVPRQIGRASCRARVWQYVELSVDAVSVKKKETKKSRLL